MKILKFIQLILVGLLIVFTLYQYTRKLKQQSLTSPKPAIETLLPEYVCEDKNPNKAYIAAEISAAADAETLLNSGRFFPHIVEDKIIGFRFCGLDDDGPFAKACFRNGDIVEAVNSTKLESPESGFEIIDAFLNPGTTNFQIIRDGKSTSIKLLITKGK